MQVGFDLLFFIPYSTSINLPREMNREKTPSLGKILTLKIVVFPVDACHNIGNDTGNDTGIVTGKNPHV